MSDENDSKPAESQKAAQVHGLLAEYESDTQLIEAAKKVRDQGYERWDSYSPYPVHGIDPAMGIKQTKLPWFVLCAGLTGCVTAVTVQWWTNAVDYPWVISGKPLWSIPANIPITFELTVLFSAITAFVSMLLLNGLPKHSSPLDRVKRFARVTDDRFFIMIEASDPKFDNYDTKELLQETKPLGVEAVAPDTSSDRVPMGLIYGILILGALALIPFGVFASAREGTSGKPQFHVVPNMDWQQKYKAQTVNDFFGDNRATRLPVEGTVAVGELREDDHFYRGKVNGAWARTLPEQVKVNPATMARGKERFDIYCTPCHSETGDGDGMVHRRAAALLEGTWVKPTNISEAKIRSQAVGQYFNTISNGIRNMPGYARQIPPQDRWAIVLYMRALQRSQAQYVAKTAPAATGDAPTP